MALENRQLRCVISHFFLTRLRRGYFHATPLVMGHHRPRHGHHRYYDGSSRHGHHRPGATREISQPGRRCFTWACAMDTATRDGQWCRGMSFPWLEPSYGVAAGSQPGTLRMISHWLFLWLEPPMMIRNIAAIASYFPLRPSVCLNPPRLSTMVPRLIDPWFHLGSSCGQSHPDVPQCCRSLVRPGT